MSYKNPSVKFLVDLAEKTFTRKKTLNQLHQEIAENFYPERADFTYNRHLGDEFADHLYDSYPVLVRRDLGNQLSAMLRPTEKEWHIMQTTNYDKVDHAGKSWLEWANKRQNFFMYERSSNFVRATKEGDHDFATFGQTVIEPDINKNRTGLTYRCHHLRDMAWVEDEFGQIIYVFRKWKPMAHDLGRIFGEDKCHETVKRAVKKDPLKEINCMHIMAPGDRYEGEGYRNQFDWVSLYVDIENEHQLEVMPSRRRRYVIPRWQTVSGSQYAYSPATITALPDARMIQAMTLVLLEAGEKFVNPPLVATQEAVRSDAALYAGGITWVDKDYDERLGDALRPLTTDKNGLPIGFQMSDMTKQQIRECFYLNQIRMPMLDKEATAYEVGQIVQEYIRNALPLFEPMEVNYNGELCEETFDLLFWNGAFGGINEIPESLRGKDIEFKFMSPLHDAEGQGEAQRILEVQQILGSTMEFDPTVNVHVDFHQAFRGAIDRMNVPKEWIVDEKVAMQRLAAIQQQQEAAAEAEAMQQAAETAKTGSEAEKNLSDAE